MHQGGAELRRGMLRAMDELEHAERYLLSALERLPPMAQEAARDALADLARARLLAMGPDAGSLAALAPQELAELLRARREAAGLSQKRVAELAGLSERTIKNLEHADQSPTLDTLQRLSSVAELGLVAAGAGRSDAAAARPVPNSWFLPRYDRRALIQELQERANAPGAALEQTMLYLDDQSAQDYLDLCGSDAFAARFRALPLGEIATAILQRTGERPLDINALGPGDGRTEVELAAELLNRCPTPLRLHLLDISHPLLVIAHERARERLGPRAQVQTLHGDFHHLFRYPMLLPDASTAGRRRVYTMLGVTMANLDNEVAFVRDQLSLAASGDLCVLDYQLAYAPPDQPERIRALDPPLVHGVSAHQSWMTGPLRRYCRDVSKLEIGVELNTRALVPGSYEVDCFALIHPAQGRPHRHLVFRSRRYTPEPLHELFREFGWSLLCDLPFGPEKRSAVMLMERR